MKNCHENLDHLATADKASCMLKCQAARVHANKGDKLKPCVVPESLQC